MKTDWLMIKTAIVVVYFIFKFLFEDMFTKIFKKAIDIEVYGD